MSDIQEEQKRLYKIAEENDIKYEDYHIVSMQVFCIIEDNKHKIKTIVDYDKNQKHYRKVYENVLEE